MQNSNKNLVFLSLLLVICSQSVHATLVTGVYQGEVTQDSGLGLNGQTMQVVLTYEDTTTGATSGDSTTYSGLITSTTVSIGMNLWTYDGSGSSTLFLRDNDVVTFSNGPEDRVTLFVSDFVGPDLGTGPIAFGPELSVFMSDLLPDDMPDAVIDDAVLPPVAFDPLLFSNGSSFSLSWSTENDQSYSIVVDSFSAAPIPIPAAFLLFSSALGFLTILRHKFS